jgi:hypothetical protein
MKRFGYHALMTATLLGLQACAGVTAGMCGPGLIRMTEAQLFFGRNIQGAATVTDQQWRDFVDEEVMPRFPEGFSVGDVYGQYRNQSGIIVREPSKQLLIVSRDMRGDEPKLNAIRDAYKRRFNQESVLLVEAPVCAGF